MKFTQQLTTLTSCRLMPPRPSPGEPELTVVWGAMKGLLVEPGSEGPPVVEDLPSRSRATDLFLEKTRFPSLIWAIHPRFHKIMSCIP